ncbi:MAG TPA: 4-alpha-glucanotransferase [Candidatus Krumholzibacteria bacterium]|nr:4-alpha-glucanotransferase [Candidatus Krumholzibacteria bacterium]
MTDARPEFRRRAGVLLHPTSLPGPDGIGDLGAEAYRWIDWLAEHAQSLWQVLPLGPTSFGDSPYQTLSAFAGNPLLVSLDRLAQRGWLTPADLAARPALPVDRVDYGPVITWKTTMLDLAWQRARASAAAELEAWGRRHAWLEDFVLFWALKEDQGGRPWVAWPAELRDREPAALAAARTRLAPRLEAHRFRQWQFFTQWQELKLYAQARDVAVMGDLPIFVAYDSADVWANRSLFRLDAEGRPTHVAGVPPDYFSDTGQLWGNPLYDWTRSAADGHAWWAARVRTALELCDLLRIDHFRGFEAYWEVPAGETTAVNGAWRPGPGAAFFTALQASLGGRLPLVAEDLGVITPGVEALREGTGLPGMKVLQFAFDDPCNAFLPHRHQANCVVYTGTHDNDPTRGWWEHRATDGEKRLVAEYAGAPADEPHWTLIRLGMLSPAHTFIAPLQDVLGLGREARMNLPGEGAGNWNWRMPADAFTHPGGPRLARLTWLGARRPDQTRPTPPVGSTERTA